MTIERIGKLALLFGVAWLALELAIATLPAANC